MLAHRGSEGGATRSKTRRGPLWCALNNGVFSARAEKIPLDQEMKLGFRAYLDPRTGIGPAWWEMLYDRVITFKSSR